MDGYCPNQTWWRTELERERRACWSCPRSPGGWVRWGLWTSPLTIPRRLPRISAYPRRTGVRTGVWWWPGARAPPARGQGGRAGSPCSAPSAWRRWVITGQFLSFEQNFFLFVLLRCSGVEGGGGGGPHRYWTTHRCYSLQGWILEFFKGRGVSGFHFQTDKQNNALRGIKPLIPLNPSNGLYLWAGGGAGIYVSSLMWV